MSMTINRVYGSLDSVLKTGLDKADRFTNYRAHLYGDQEANRTNLSRPESLPAGTTPLTYTRKDIKNIEFRKREYIKGAAVMGLCAAANTLGATLDRGNQEILKGFNPMERPVRSAQFLSTAGFLMMAYKTHQEKKIALQNHIDERVE